MNMREIFMNDDVNETGKFNFNNINGTSIGIRIVNLPADSRYFELNVQWKGISYYFVSDSKTALFIELEKLIDEYDKALSLRVNKMK